MSRRPRSWRAAMRCTPIISGVCWATAGPGAFNLFSGLGMAMSDSYPMLAITGYANRHWMGRGSLNETSALNRTPDSQEMFAACTKGSWIIDHPDQTCDILEQAVNTAFAGRPGPVHIAVPGEFNLPGHDVTNHRRIQRSAETVSPDPARVDEIAVMLADAFAKGKSVVALVGFGAIRSGANSAVKELHRAFPDPVAHDARWQGHRLRKPSAVSRRVLRQWPCQRLEGVHERRCRRGDRQRVQPARDIQLLGRLVRRPHAGPHQHFEERNRQGL